MRLRYRRSWHVIGKNFTWQRGAADYKEGIWWSDIPLGSWLGSCKEYIANGRSLHELICRAHLRDNTHDQKWQEPKWGSNNMKRRRKRQTKRRYRRRINRIWFLSDSVVKDDTWGFGLSFLPSWKQRSWDFLSKDKLTFALHWVRFYWQFQVDFSRKELDV